MSFTGKTKGTSAPIALEGQESTVSGGFRNITPFTAESALTAGKALNRGTADRSCKLAVATGTDDPAFLGVAITDRGIINVTEADTIPVNGNVSVVRQGYVTVMVSTAVTPDTPVRYQAGGLFGGDSGGVELTAEQANYEASASAGGLVELRLNV